MKKNIIGDGQNAIFAALAVSDTNPHDFILPPGAMKNIDNISFELLTLTGSTLAGAWTIWASNDYADDTAFNALPNAGTFIDITALFTTIAAVVSGASSRYTQMIGCAARALRVRFVATSGSGTIQVFPFGKGAQ